MAGRGKKTKSKPKARAKVPGADATARILDAAMAIAAEDGWAAVSPESVAARAGLAEKTVADLCPDRAAVLKALAARADEAVAGGTSEHDEPRDRIFDAVMKRLDALQPYRAGLKAAARGQIGDPKGALAVLCGLRGSMAKTLEAAGVETAGPLGALRTKGLGLIYLDALRVFFDDESDDLGKTMAALDRRLKQVDRIVGALSTFGLGGRAAA